MNTKLTGIKPEWKENCARRCAELDSELVAIGHNGERLIVMAKRNGSDNFNVWTCCVGTGSFSWGTYNVSEETATEIFYTGNSHLRTEIVDVKCSISYDRLVEIATRYKDVAFESDYDAAMETTREDIGMCQDEADFFEIDLCLTEEVEEEPEEDDEEFEALNAYVDWMLDKEEEESNE